MKKLWMVEAEQHLWKVRAYLWTPFHIVEVRLEQAPERLPDRIEVSFLVDIRSLSIQIERNVYVRIYVLHSKALGLNIYAVSAVNIPTFLVSNGRLCQMRGSSAEV